MTHTPGPWKYDPGEGVTDHPKVMAGNQNICLLSSVGGNREEQGRNARLIAAAPELLEELEKSDDLIAMLIVHFSATASSKVFDERIKHIEERREARKALFNRINLKN